MHTEHHSIEVGGPEGIRINSTHSSMLDLAPPTEAPGQAMSIAARHSRAIAAGLATVGIGLLAGPLVIILALELPIWTFVGPVVFAAAAFVGAIAVSRGALLELDRARRRPDLERRLLEMATHTRGRLTVPLAARLLSISLSEAEDMLTSLARSGHVEIDNDPETGAVLYLFPSLDQHR
jgi:hypothetical protein